MTTIFVVNHITGGYHTYASSFYYHTEEEARLAFAEAKESVGGDQDSIELVRLNTETQETFVLHRWEGSST